MVTHSCANCNREYNRHANYVLHMQTANGITYRYINKSSKLNTDTKGGKRTSRMQRVAEAAKQISIEYERILDIKEIKKHITNKIMEEKEDLKYNKVYSMRLHFTLHSGK